MSSSEKGEGHWDAEKQSAQRGTDHVNTEVGTGGFIYEPRVAGNYQK